MSLTQAARAFADALLGDDPVALYNHAPCGYLTTLPDGTVVKANQTFLTLTGYDAERVLSHRLLDLLAPGSRLFYETHLVPLLRLQDSVREIALDVVRHDGSRLPVLLNASVERDEHGEQNRVRIAVFEATERRRYERELLRATEAAQRARHEAEEAERRSRSMVDTLQTTLIPQALPSTTALDLAGAYRPAGDGSEVGGDFYDAFEAHGDWWLVLGDVSGKGIEAAVVTGLVRNGARALTLSLLENRREPCEILRMLDQLVEHHQTQRFCTAAVVRLRPRTGGWHLTYASGGHPPLVYRPAQGGAELVSVSGPALGLSLPPDFEQTEKTLHAGDTVLLHTDGVTEARAGELLYGDDRLLHVVEGCVDATAAVHHLVEDVLRYSSARPRDDVACLAVTVY